MAGMLITTLLSGYGCQKNFCDMADKIVASRKASVYSQEAELRASRRWFYLENCRGIGPGLN
jgi:hypothetical protein